MIVITDVSGAREYTEVSGPGCTMPVGEKQIFRFGPFHLDTQCGQLRRDGVGLKLQGQPVQILEILLENK